MSNNAHNQQGRLFGLLNVDKPQGWSSRQVVSHVQRILRSGGRREKVGHAGTLDPLATGVLVLGVGPATRLVEYVQRTPKRYVATFLLGRRSDTEDTEGQVTPLDDPPVPSIETIESARSRFIGSIAQTPPRYSAIKVGGRRAYKMARAGEEVPLTPRQVRIDAIEIVRYDYPELVVDITCGSGTYVRSLGRDLAESMGTAAVMSALRRTGVGSFTVDEAVAPEDLTEESLLKHLLSPLAAVPSLPQRTVTPNEQSSLANGQSITLFAPEVEADRAIALAKESAAEDFNEWAAVDAAGRLVAILKRRDDGRLWPLRNFAGG